MFQWSVGFFIGLLWVGLVVPEKAYAMHIMEGFLPAIGVLFGLLSWCPLYFLVFDPQKKCYGLNQILKC